MNKKIKLLAILSMLVLFASTFHSCKKSTAVRHKTISVNPSFKKYVEGFTTGPVSKEASVRIRLTYEIADTTMLNKPLSKNPVIIKPKIKGTTFWIDKQTLEFRPEEQLPANTFFEANFNLSEIMKVPDSLSKMVFSFHTIAQEFEVFIENSKAYSQDDLSKEKLTGYVLTADVEDIEKMKNLITASQKGKILPVTVRRLLFGGDVNPLHFPRRTKVSIYTSLSYEPLPRH